MNNRQRISGNYEIELERQIDDTLALYIKAEPRQGFEGRLLARLAEARTRSNPGWRSWGALALGAAATLAIAVVWPATPSHDATKPKTLLAHTEMPQKPNPAGKTVQESESSGRLASSKPVSPSRQRSGDRSAQAQADNSPKLAQFPSRRNLSEAESLLVRRLNERPDQDALLESAAPLPEIEVSIDSLEIRPIQIPDIEISQSETNY
jgi:hypothetical protein